LLIIFKVGDKFNKGGTKGGIKGGGVKVKENGDGGEGGIEEFERKGGGGNIGDTLTRGKEE